MSQTVTKNVPPYTATALTAILAKNVQDLTLAEIKILQDCAKRTPLGSVPSNTIGECLP